MSHTVRTAVVVGLGALSAVFFASSNHVHAQRVQFPTSPPSNPFATSAPAATFAPNTGVPSLGTTPYASPYSSAPVYSPTWDPYALPGSTTAPPPALPAYGTQPAQPSLGFPFQDWSAPSTKLVQGVGMQYTYIHRAGDNPDSFGIEDVDLSASLAFPFFHNVNIAPILFTPGFNFHFLQGPGGGFPRDVPPTVYDVYMQLSWKPQFYERLGADLAVSVGAYTDFSYTDHESIRLLGRALATYKIGPRWQIAAGIVYLDRLDIKILPAGGIIWTPHDDARFELLFPQPKLSQRITNWSNYELWGYLGGEYGGGQWSISHANGARDVINYNDFRIFVGVEGIGPRLRAHFDVGYVFHRELLYLSGPPILEPDDSFMLRAGFTY